MVLKRVFAALVAVVVIAAAASGCTGLSKSDADVRCNQEQLSKTACFDGPMGQVFAACESCYERCGNDCTPQETCPETYHCPGDSPGDGGTH
jgi:hypothetical protein